MKTVETTVSFGRDYFSRHFGICFDKPYFEDVRTRVQTDQAVQRSLHERFGALGLGSPDPPPLFQLGYDDTLNIALLFGGTIQYRAGLTWVDPGFVPLFAIRALRPPSPESTWPHTLFLEQFDQAVALFGPGAVLPPVPHGVLETALDMCGDALLTAMADQADEVHHLLGVLTETIIRVKEFWDVKCYGRVRRGLSLGGCSTTMLSPEMVAEFLVPRYCRIASHFKEAFICNCGVSDQNMDNFLSVEDARYVRFGWGSDLKNVAGRFQQRHVKAGLDVVRAATLPPDELKKDVLHILEALSPADDVSVLLIHAGADTPDENVRIVFDTVREFAAKHGIELSDEQRVSRLRGT